MKSYLLLLALLSVVLVGCVEVDSGCPTIVNICPDGSTPAQDLVTCEFAECPEPESLCNPDIVGVDGPCTLEYAPVCDIQGKEYSNACAACRSGIIYFSSDFCPFRDCPMSTKFCADGTTLEPDPKNNCEIPECPTADSDKLELTQCDPDIIGVEGVCTREYAPVCGNTPVQCITAPCPDLQETFSNGCTACRGGAITYTEGAC